MDMLALLELDKQIQQIAANAPEEGWIRTIRKCLGMTTKQLAKRLRVNRSRITKIEQAEPDGALTLRTLQEVAEALNCKLAYTLVPQVSLHAVVEQQAQRIVLQRYPDDNLSPTHLQDLIAELLAGAAKNLWEE